MKFTLAFLAEYAVVEDGGDNVGKLHVLAAGLEQIPAQSFPYVQRHLSLVMKIAFEKVEQGQEHIVQIRFTDDQGGEFRQPHVFSVSPQLPIDIITDEPGTQTAMASQLFLPVVHNMRDVRFDRPGKYSFTVLLPEGKPGATLVLELIGPLENERSLNALLTAGYRSFMSGDVDGASAIFEQLVRNHPESSMAHNDYGFVNLARGKASEAIRSFERARQLGFPLTELCDANIACCEYLLDHFEEAFGHFRELLGAPLQNVPAVLFAIDRTALRPVQLTTAVHFVSLMALNAGYSALAAGSPSDALQFAQIATAGRVTFTDERDAESFIPALDHLLEDCKLADEEAEV